MLEARTELKTLQKAESIQVVAVRVVSKLFSMLEAGVKQDFVQMLHLFQVTGHESF